MTHKLSDEMLMDYAVEAQLEKKNTLTCQINPNLMSKLNMPSEDFVTKYPFPFPNPSYVHIFSLI